MSAFLLLYYKFVQFINLNAQILLIFQLFRIHRHELILPWQINLFLFVTGLLFHFLFSILDVFNQRIVNVLVNVFIRKIHFWTVKVNERIWHFLTHTEMLRFYENGSNFLKVMVIVQNLLNFANWSLMIFICSFNDKFTLVLWSFIHFLTKDFWWNSRILFVFVEQILDNI